MQFRYGTTGKIPLPRRQHIREKFFRCPFQYPKMPLEARALPIFWCFLRPACTRKKISQSVAFVMLQFSCTWCATNPMGFKGQRDFRHVGWYLHCKQAKSFVNVIQHGDADETCTLPIPELYISRTSAFRSHKRISSESHYLPSIWIFNSIQWTLPIILFFPMASFPC